MAVRVKVLLLYPQLLPSHIDDAPALCPLRDLYIRQHLLTPAFFTEKSYY